MSETMTARRTSTAITFANLADLIPGVVGGSAGVGILEHIRDVVDANLDRASAVMSVQAGSSAEATVDATPRKITAWNTDGSATNMTVDSTTGNDITADVAGRYIVMISISFTGTASKTFQFEIFKNGVASGFAVDRKTGAGGDVGSISIHGMFVLVVNDTIELYQSSSDGATAITITEGQMVINRGGP